jgi:hypothetical protein
MRGLRGGMFVSSFGAFCIRTHNQTGLVHTLPKLRNLLPRGCAENDRHSRGNNPREGQVGDGFPDEDFAGVSSLSLTLKPSKNRKLLNGSLEGEQANPPSPDDFSEAWFNQR